MHEATPGAGVRQQHGGELNHLLCAPTNQHTPGPLLLQVCGNSAKVQLNSGILERRYQNWEAALRHFERARAIEPGYCEPDYWVGLTLVNQGRDIEGGIQVSSDGLSSFMRS